MRVEIHLLLRFLFMLSDNALQEWLASQSLHILAADALSGGCIAQCFCLRLSDGQRYFLKQQERAEPGQFVAEAAGLEALAATEGVPTPQVIWVSEQSLLLEYLPPAARQKSFSTVLGEGLARQHCCPVEGFGFERDSWCGATRQPNGMSADGYQFFAERRLRYLARICGDKGLLSRRQMDRVERICERLPELIPGQAPALLHGDLWSGNVHTGPDGLPVLIDPAVYQGWPEAELAMTCLFGGFDQAFYSAYESNYPLLPDWRERIALYNLWHLLNHLSLFGRSYLQEVDSILRRYA
ncbi:fructosamine kinase family protein [Pontibacterium granulatum]|uniref:fructosamine kinase family protein n=1 Tax=Pontibacterium granulatum TaxID=2036029 RepID=UPI0031F2FB81